MFIAGECGREREREVKGPALWELAVRVCARTYPRPRARTKTIARPRGRVTTAGKRYIIAREVFWAGAACPRGRRGEGASGSGGGNKKDGRLRVAWWTRWSTTVTALEGQKSMKQGVSNMVHNKADA